MLAKLPIKIQTTKFLRLSVGVKTGRKTINFDSIFPFKSLLKKVLQHVYINILLKSRLTSNHLTNKNVLCPKTSHQSFKSGKKRLAINIKLRAWYNLSQIRLFSKILSSSCLWLCSWLIDLTVVLVSASLSIKSLTPTRLACNFVILSLVYAL